MRITLSTHLFAFHELDEGIAQLFYRFGFRHAELWAMLPHFSYRDDGEADRVAGMLRSREVSVAGFHAPLYPDVRTYKKDRWYSLSSRDEEHRRASVEATAAAGRCLARLGGGTLILHTSFPSDDWYPRKWGAFLSSMNELLDQVPDTVTLAVENTFLPSGSIDITLDIVKRYPPERVGVCLDLGHAQIQEIPAKAIRDAGPRLVHVHAHDNHGLRDDHLVPGRGTIDWKQVAAALAEVGFGGPLSLELRDHTKGAGGPYNSFEDILDECRKAMDRFFGGAG